MATLKKPRQNPVIHKQKSWQLQTAKARFSELFRRAQSEGPQWVTRMGKEAVVVVAAEEFERLSGQREQPGSPDLERQPDYGRAVNL